MAAAQPLYWVNLVTYGAGQWKSTSGSLWTGGKDGLRASSDLKCGQPQWSEMSWLAWSPSPHSRNQRKCQEKGGFHAKAPSQASDSDARLNWEDPKRQKCVCSATKKQTHRKTGNLNTHWSLLIWAALSWTQYRQQEYAHINRQKQAAKILNMKDTVFFSINVFNKKMYSIIFSSYKPESRKHFLSQIMIWPKQAFHWLSLINHSALLMLQYSSSSRNIAYHAYREKLKKVKLRKIKVTNAWPHLDASSTINQGMEPFRKTNLPFVLTSIFCSNWFI